MTRETVKLTRDCEGVMVPSGQKMRLPSGTSVTITQALGSSFTIVTEQGYMIGIDGRDADALGKEMPEALRRIENDKDEPVEVQVWNQIRTCFDPEIPVNIADLGLIYRCEVEPLETGLYNVEIHMTLTAPGCGMGEHIRQDVLNKTQSLEKVNMVNVELVWNPPWDRSMMSEAAKLQLGMM